MSYESKEGDQGKCSLIFLGCESFKCTYMTSLNPEQIEASYGCVVSITDSPWLQEIRAKQAPKVPAGVKLRHLMICFDDGPCYEFVCSDFKAT
jgi:hypothetical protein